MDKEWWENSLLVTVTHRIDRPMLVRALTISLHQLGQVGLTEPGGGWSVEGILCELRYELEERGSDLKPGWLLESDYLDHREEIESLADKAESLVGQDLILTCEINHFGLVNLFEYFLEEETGLRVAESALPPRLEGQRGGSQFVRIPSRIWGIAEPPRTGEDLKRFLQTVERSLLKTRTKFDAILQDIVRTRGQYLSCRVLHTDTLRTAAEAIVDRHYPDQARCPRLGLFYVKDNAEGRTEFCNHVCEEHARDRAALIGEPRHNDGPGERPRRCAFSRNIPILTETKEP